MSRCSCGRLGPCVPGGQGEPKKPARIPLCTSGNARRCPQAENPRYSVAGKRLSRLVEAM